MSRAEWNEVLDLLARSVRLGIRVALPARVVAVDGPAGRVRCRPEILLPRPDPELPPDQVPELFDVPVLFPSSGTTEIAFALEPGDRGLVVFADHALGGWLQTGETSAPPVNDPHGLSGAVFCPGLWPRGQHVPIPAAGVVVGVRNGEALEVVGNEVRGGRGASEALALKADLETLLSVINDAPVGVSDGGLVFKEAVVEALDLLGWPTGTSVLKGK